MSEIKFKSSEAKIFFFPPKIHSILSEILLIIVSLNLIKL